MRQTFIAALLGGLLACAPAARAQPAEAEVLILGTYHFSGGGRDLVNPDAGDVLTPAAQAQIEDVVARLAAFAPTRIAVERAPARQGELDAAYSAYRAGTRALTRNEIDQIGMRLAARLGHARIYAVDHLSDMDFDGTFAAARAAGQTALLAAADAAFADVRAATAEAHGDGNVLNRLRAENGPRVENLHNLYFTLAQLGPTEDPAGARMVGGWLTRNVIIFSNIARLAEPGERVLVIYGSGHLQPLKQYVAASANLRLVDALDYLGR